MIKNLRIRHFLNVLKILWQDRTILSTKNNIIKPNTLLIVKLDAIGDYLLFRNFLEDIRKSEKFRNYQITLCGNELWKELAEKLDELSVDEFIWINKKKFVTDLYYRKNILETIRNKGFETAFQPTFSREIITGDSIIKASGSIKKTGSLGDDANEISIFKKIADNYYTQLLNKNSSVVFEFEKNKLIVEELIEEKINRQKTVIEILSSNESVKKYAILFPGAGEKQKQWPLDRFSAIADELYSKHELEIKICGAHSDIELAKQIITECKIAKPINLCGETNLLALVDIIANASFLLTNDSSALHIAACTNTKTVCVLNGRHYGRFAPYPKLLNPNLVFVYPNMIDDLVLKNPINVIQITKYHSPSLITEIPFEKVKMAIEKIVQ